MEVLIVNDRKRLANRLRYNANTMKVLSRMLKSESTRLANDVLVDEIRAVAEELFPLQLERDQELERAWNMGNTFVRYNRGDVFATLHDVESHDILALSLVKFDQTNYSVDVAPPEHVSRQIATGVAWTLLMDHLRQSHRLTAQGMSIR